MSLSQKLAPKLQSVVNLIQNICEFLTYTDIDYAEEAWLTQVEPFLTPSERDLASLAFDWIFPAFEEMMVQSLEELAEEVIPLEARLQKVQALLDRPQMQQRSEEWYADADQILTASQFSTLFKSARTRGQLVLEKAGVTQKAPRSNRLACKAEDSSPFDWGIRFEPVVKQMYCDITKTDLAELGRLRHQTEKHLAASPDGLVVKDLSGSEMSRVGRFVEFKAPVTRVLTRKVPEDYYMQMQIQMEVGDVNTCDYFEVKFKSAYGKKQENSPHSVSDPYYGIVLVIGSAETEEATRYEFSPLNVTSWSPSTLSEGEKVLQEIPWSSSDWWLVTVNRSKSWFESVKPAIESFWLDVEKARQGLFVLPESTRKPKQVVCLLVDEPEANSNVESSEPIH